jgi:glycosyltransferase involved in cell wall biosynthesis
MHIALNGWFWNQPHTGSGQYLRLLLHHLRLIAPELQLTLILPPGDNTLDNLPKNISLVTTKGPGGKLGKIWFEQRIFPKMVKRCGADIAHVPYWGPPLSSPVKLVTSILDVIPLVIPDYARGLGNRLYTSLVSTAASGSAHTITISDAAKADIVEHLGIAEESITTTYLAADDRFHPKIGAENDEAVREKYGLPDQFVLYIGGFDLRKQINLLLLAYTYVIQVEGEQVPLVLAGREPQWGTSVFPDMRQYAKELGITENLIWPGYIDEADKPALYRLADVMVFPTMLEGFGLPPLEAMACGTPVVANDIDVLQEVLGDSAFLTNNARKMAGAIIALLEQDPFRESMINLGLGRATAFSWRKTAQKTLEVYERVYRI